MTRRAVLGDIQCDVCLERVVQAGLLGPKGRSPGRMVELLALPIAVVWRRLLIRMGQ